ncbi:MAG TPA: hypothetical protein VNC11_07170 [Gemmatimonadaceae bacterium]|nr:hypothetical protein [Gemmatimonadaceae bacterium]
MLRLTASRLVAGVTVIVLASWIPSCTSETAPDPNGSAPRLSNSKSTSTATADPNAYFTFADSINVAASGSPASWTRAGIQGDGRLINGAAGSASLSNEYQGDYCGVYAVVGYSQKAEATFNVDSDINWTSTMQPVCGSARLFAFYLGGSAAPPTMNGPHSVIDTLGVLSVGQVSHRLVKFGVQLSNCDGIRFGNDYPPASDAKVMRLADVTTSSGSVAKQWRVESQGSHRGACVNRTKNGSFVSSGVTYYLPFAITIREVLQPAPKFP